MNAFASLNHFLAGVVVNMLYKKRERHIWWPGMYTRQYLFGLLLLPTILKSAGLALLRKGQLAKVTEKVRHKQMLLNARHTGNKIPRKP